MSSLECWLPRADFRKSVPFVLVLICSAVGNPIDVYTGTEVKETETSGSRIVF